MAGYWSTRWRRGLVTRNYHWRAAMFNRWGNWLLGRGFKTDAELEGERDRDRKRRLSEIKIECLMCGKHFRRPSPLDTSLRPHKSPLGLRCDCTTGFSAE